jgi:hypothetical protein
MSGGPVLEKSSSHYSNGIFHAPQRGPLDRHFILHPKGIIASGISCINFMGIIVMQDKIG